MGYRESVLQRRLCSRSPCAHWHWLVEGIQWWSPGIWGPTATIDTVCHPQRFSEGWEQAQELHREWLCSWRCSPGAAGVGLRAGLHQSHQIGSAPAGSCCCSPQIFLLGSILFSLSIPPLSTSGQAALAQPQVFHGCAAGGFHGITGSQAGLAWKAP